MMRPRCVAVCTASWPLVERWPNEHIRGAMCCAACRYGIAQPNDLLFSKDTTGDLRNVIAAVKTYDTRLVAVATINRSMRFDRAARMV